MRYQKVVKTNGTETSRYDYVYSDGKLILITYTENGASDTARFIYDSMGEPRGFILNNTATYLYIKNAQGDITGIVNEDGDVILTCSYNAWGKVTFASTNMEYMALAAKLSKINPFTYRGYCYDYDIEMYYLQSRYYDPEICRFINADSTDYLGATGTLLSYNLFAYCENEPVNRVDPKGNDYILITSSYTNLYEDLYFMNTEINYVSNNGTKSLGSMFYIFEGGIVEISTSVPALERLVKNKRLYYFARGIFYCTKSCNKKSMTGRTIKGIQFEILIHYIIYIGLKNKKNKTEQETNDFRRVRKIDIGSAKKNTFGYDSNAKTFEKYKNYYNLFESRLFSNKYTAYALYKIAYSLGLT